MTKIMIYATGPNIGTGYASAGRYTSLLLQEHGYDVIYNAWNTFRGGEFTWGPLKMIGGGYTISGWDVLGGHVRKYGVDIILAICDPWITRPDLWQHGHNASIIFWYPCQAYPASPDLIASMRDGAAKICYSRWGNKVMRDAGVDSEYVPLGVATHIYKPLEDKAAQKSWLGSITGIEEAAERFIVGMVAANSTTLPLMRKAFDQNIRAFKRFQAEIDPTAVLYLHTEPTEMAGGIHLPDIIKSEGLTIGKDVFFPPSLGQSLNYYYRTGQIDDAWMTRLYNACDVMLQATMGEGFGLPILEAQACGTPVIVTDFSSMPELTAYGYKAKVATEQWVPGQIKGYVGCPDPNDIFEGLWRVRDDRRGWIGTPDEGIALARSLDWEVVVDDYLLPVIERVERERHERHAARAARGAGDLGRNPGSSGR